MTDQQKTVDEIMEMLREYKISHFDRSNQNAVGVAIRAAITDLHEDARQQRTRADGLEVLVSLQRRSDELQCADIETLRSRVAELEAALMPFAEVGCFNDCQHDYDVARKAMGLGG